MFSLKNKKDYWCDNRVQVIAYWSLMVGIFLLYWLFNTPFYGPAYLLDEVGYITKAATLAGYSIDLSNHWNGGYPIIISPLFKFSFDPFQLWQALLVFQAFIWVFSFMLLFKLLKEFFPNGDYWEIYFAVVISAAYPSWISMSGYAFATTLFVFVYMLSIYTMLKISFDNILSIVPHILLVGFLYWIHPAGKVTIAASFLVLSAYAWYYGKLKSILVYILIASVLIVAYKWGIHSWLDHAMTAKNYKSEDHYKTITSVLKAASNHKFWIAWFLMFWGSVASIFISTFGLVAYALVAIWSRLKGEFHNRKDVNNQNLINAALFFMAISFLGIAMSGSLSLASPSVHHRVPHSFWNYERYLDMVLLPLLGIGFLSTWKLIHAKAMFVIVFLSGILIYAYTSTFHTNGNFDNLVDTQSFWPVALLQNNNYILTFTAGAIGIVLVYIFRKKIFIYILLFLWGITVLHQGSWHWLWLNGYKKAPILYRFYSPDFPDIRAIRGHSSPSSLYDLITSNYSKGECIGFDQYAEKSSFNYKKERRNLYAYYLFEYDIKRMSPTQWMQECDGPYLTYRPKKLFKEKDVKIIAREMRSGLYVVAKEDDSIKSSSFPLHDLEIFTIGHDGKDK